jgi:protein TonB
MNASGAIKTRSPSPAKSAAYTWAFPGAPVRVVIDLDTVNQIQRTIDADSTAALTGLLVGIFDGKSVHIHGAIPLSHGDANQFEAVIAAHSSSTRSIAVGFYIAEVKESLRLDTAQIELAKRFFPSPQSVVLLIQIGQGPIPNASFFFWDDGQFLGDFAFLEFPFDARLLAKDVAVGDGGGSDEHRIPAADESNRKMIGVHPRRIRKWIFALAFVCTFIGLTAIALWTWSKWKYHAEPSAAPAPPDSSIGLRAERSGTDFRVTWDRNSSAVRSAIWGALAIHDGNDKREVSLRREDLHEGSVLFEPQQARVQVQLSLVMPDQTLKSESVLLLLTESGPLKIEQRTGGTFRPKVASAPVNISAPGAPTIPLSAGDENRVTGGGPIRVFIPPQRSPLPVPQTILSEPAFQVDMPAVSRKSQKLADLPIIPPPPVEKTAVAEKLPTPAKIPEPPVYIGATPIAQPKPALTSMLRAFLPGEKTVSVRVHVDERGYVTRAETIPEHGLSQYVAAVSQNTAMMWRFRPATRNGKPVPSDYIIGFHFNP